MPFQYGPWGEVLSQYKFLFVGSMVNLSPAPDADHAAYEEPTISIDWSLKLTSAGQTMLFKRIRGHFEQATRIIDDVKEKRKYRQSEEDLQLLRNLVALWDQLRVFCKSRMSSFTEMDEAMSNNNHKDADLRAILDQRPAQFGLSMLPSAREAALKAQAEQEESATLEVEKQRLEVRQARWKFFTAGLERDQGILLQISSAPQKLNALRHRKAMTWRLEQAKKGEKIIQSYMSKYLCCEFVEKVEHAQQKVNEFRAFVVPRLEI